MTRPALRQLAVAVGAAIALASGGTSTALAAGATARIEHATVANGKLTVVLSATGLAPGQTIDPASVTLSVNGVPVTATGTLSGEAGNHITRTVVLAVDISGSMQGAPLSAAKSAIHTFAAAVPADVRIGLVSFERVATVVQPPSTDRGLLLSATDALAVKGETSLYDGLILAIATAGTTGARSVVVLSDGADTTSAHTTADVERALKRGVLVDVVPFNTSGAHVSTLAAWARSTGGRAIQASSAAELASAFTAVAGDTTNQVQLVADVPADVGGPVTVTAGAQAGAALLTASTVTSFPALPVPTPTPLPSTPSPTPSPSPSPTVVAAPAPPAEIPVTPSRLAPKSQLNLGLGALFVALVVILAFALGIGRTDKNTVRVQKHMEVYSLRGRKPRKQQEASAFGDSSVARSAVELADRVATARGFDASLRRRLDAGGVPLRAGEWTLLHVGIALGTAFVLFAVSGGKMIPAAFGLLIGLVLPAGYLSVKHSRRKASFAGQLPQTLQLVAGSLSAGFSLPQAFDTAAREGDAPMSEELHRALVQTRLGAPLEDALESVGDRMGSKDFAWVVMAIRIQRDVGGNLAEVLTTVAETLRERERLRRQVITLSAEGKLSGYILFALPVVMALYMLLVRPEYISVLWHKPLGLALLAVGIGLQIAGAFWLKKVVTVEV